MPTGYTEYIENGNILTGRDFVLLCTRAFGLAIELKDEPLDIPTPKIFEPDTAYYEASLKKALDEKQRLLETTQAAWHEECVAKREERIAEAKKHFDKQVQLYKRYAKIEADIEEWNAPENCKEIKKFALEQIKISKPDLNNCLKWLVIAEREDSDDDAYKTHMELVENDISYAGEQIDRAIKYAESKTKMMKELCDSLRDSFDKKETKE